MDDTPAPDHTPADHPASPLAEDVAQLDREGVRALAHPLRLRLLAALRLRGPATATELARQLDTNSGQTSYHLRQLAAAGLVEDDPDHSTARERYWRSAHQRTTWSTTDFRADPDDWAATTSMYGQMVRVHGRWMDDAVATRDAWSDAWHDASTMSDWALHLTPERSARLVAELSEVVRRHSAEDQVDAPEAERVTVLLHVFPHPEPSV